MTTDLTGSNSAMGRRCGLWAWLAPKPAAIAAAARRLRAAGIATRYAPSRNARLCWASSMAVASLAAAGALIA
jgi:hypothetical protein